jgi:16S rRNA processing protein RimM
MTTPQTDNNFYVVVGQLGKTHGVHGWLKVYSFTDPIDNLLDYSPWYIKQGTQWQELPITEVRINGNAMLAHIEGYDAPETARVLTGTEISVHRSQLPPLPAGEFFWCDLVGMQVITTTDITLGTVERLFQTGANDILVVQGQREYLIPFIKGHFVIEIQANNRRIIVDWDPEF